MPNWWIGDKSQIFANLLIEDSAWPWLIDNAKEHLHREFVGGESSFDHVSREVVQLQCTSIGGGDQRSEIVQESDVFVVKLVDHSSKGALEEQGMYTKKGWGVSFGEEVWHWVTGSSSDTHLQQ